MNTDLWLTYAEFTPSYLYPQIDVRHCLSFCSLKGDGQEREVGQGEKTSSSEVGERENKLYLLRVVDLKPTHLLQVTEKTPEPGEHGGHRSGCQGCIQKTTLKEGQVLTRNVGYWTVANGGNEFLEVALIP